MMMTLNTVPHDAYIYHNVQSYQVLQRQWLTDSTWVQGQDNQYYEFKVGGPYTIDDAHHVMVGDIWILAGQSNMRGYGFFDTDNNSNNKSDNNKGCHVFQSSESWGIVPANRPVHHLATSPRSVHHTIPDPTVREPSIIFDRGASLAPTFVDRYERTLNVPVGVVPCAHGGVTLEQWMKPQDDGDDNSANTTLYGAMMDKIRLVGGRYTGVLWYQGESDAVLPNNAAHYLLHFTRWVRQLQKDMIELHAMTPRFVYAQIGRTINHKTNDKLDLAWSRVRKAQLDVYLQQQQQLQQQHTMGIVSTIDAGMDDYIHLSASGLQKVGERMADAATALMTASPPPMIYATDVTMIHLPYNHNKHWRHLLRLDLVSNEQSATTMTWTSKDAVTGFTIHDTHSKDDASSSTVDMIYSAQINAQNQVDLYLTEKGYQQLANQENGRYVLRYGYGQNPQCNLVTTSNVAALAFGPLPIHVTSLPDSGDMALD